MKCLFQRRDYLAYKLSEDYLLFLSVTLEHLLNYSLSDWPSLLLAWRYAVVSSQGSWLVTKISHWG